MFFTVDALQTAKSKHCFIAQQAPNHTYILRDGSSLMAAYLSLIIKMQYLQCLCVICSQYPVQNTHLAKKYQHKDHFSKVQENNTASCWCWRQKCLTVEGTIMKMGCCMKKKCHIQLPSFLIPVSCVSEQMSGN